ncbi:MAG TPA: PH domain-containing protein [Thermoanaerobaculia bacterium]|nr:PH domain-containing protein [Thermoanaerobaculia bacterium]
MPSEPADSAVADRRLHPLSIFFGFAAQIPKLVLPGVFVLFSARSSQWAEWQLWAMLLLIPYTLVAVGRYITLRYRYEPHEIVIRTGLLFRNERHIPYSRIQNLDAVQNVLHRLAGVVEVRVETGGGQKAEATMRVLPVAAYEEMRRRVFAGKAAEAVAEGEAAESVPVPASTPERTLLRMPLHDLLICGFIENRGIVIIGAGFGLLWEAGLMDRLMGRWLRVNGPGGGLPEWFGGDAPGGGLSAAVVKAFLGQGELPLTRIALALTAFAGILLLIRLLSMIWALLRLYGFRIVRAGEDLRTEYGLLTRVVATIPLRRIQTLTIREGPLHQLFRRAAVRVETAGGGGGGDGEEESTAKQREWLAPLIHRDALPGFLREVLPEADLSTVEWRPVEPRAFRRHLKKSLIADVLIALPFVLMLKFWTLALLAVFIAWSVVAAHLYVRHLGWAVIDGAVLFRSGWLWRRVSVARFAKIQAVTIHESPWDRRAAMARVRVDTAGARGEAQRVDIPYLARDTARALYELLSGQAAQTAFRW